MNLQQQERERAAEQWLEDALGHLRSAGPRDGLEGRVLAGLRAHAEQRRRRWTLVLAVSAAAVLVVALVASWPRSKPDTAPNVVHKTSPANAPAPTDEVTSLPPETNRLRKREHGEVQVKSAVHRDTIPRFVETKREVFPSPAPLTEQGRLLEAYLRQTPPRELALVAARLRPDEGIEDLKIAPLEIQDLTPKTEAERNQD